MSSAALHAALTPERGGAAVVVGEHGQHLGRAVARPLLEEGADLEVPARAHGLGQHPVGHVADQHVLEAELALALHVALAGRHEDVLLLQRGERAAKVLALGVGERGERALREGPADHRSLLHEPALERPQRVEPRGQHALHGVRQRGSLAALLGDPARHLLGEQRVAARALGHGHRALEAGRQQRVHQRARLRGAERLEHELGGRAAPAAPARPPVEQLVAGEADEHERRAYPLREVLDRLEHAVVRPVDVLECDHERAAPGDRLDARAERREEQLAGALRVLLARHELRRHLDA